MIKPDQTPAYDELMEGGASAHVIAWYYAKRWERNCKLLDASRIVRHRGSIG